VDSAECGQNDRVQPPAPGPPSWAARLDAFQRKHRVLGFPIAVAYKYFDDQGNYLAALIAYYGFLSFFPLLLLLTAVLGFVLRGNVSLQHSVLESTLSQFPIIGTDLSNPRKLGGSTAGVVVGVVTSLYGGMGIANALQNAMNVAWGVPRNARPNPLRQRIRSVQLLCLGGVAVLGTTVLSALGSSADSFGASIGSGLALVLTGLSVAVNAVLFVILFRLGTARHLRIRDVALGALVAAAAWQALQYFGTAYVGTVIKHATASNSLFALVLGLIGFIYLEAVAVVVGVQLNVVRVRHLYPRALLTPFTDKVNLTPADEIAYASYVEAQRHKAFQRIGVGFDENDVGPHEERPPPKEHQADQPR
jgi:membrane protein